MRRFLARVANGGEQGGGGSFLPPQRASLQTWLKADTGVYTDTALSVPITSDLTPVGGWKDQGTLGNNATQPTVAIRPTWVKNVIGGKPAVLFATVLSNRMIIDGIASAFSGVNHAGTVMMVLALGSAINKREMGLGNSAGGTTQSWVWYSTTVAWASTRVSDAGANTTVLGGTPNLNPHVLTWASPGTTMQINVDGTSVAGPSAQAVGAQTYNVARIGCSIIAGVEANFVDAYIAEILAWSVGLTAAEQTQVRLYLERKYSIVGT